MNKAGKIISINPPSAVPGGEVLINCENFTIGGARDYGCYFDGQKARLIAASKNRILVLVPENLSNFETEVYLESAGERSEAKKMFVGKKLADNLHLVANPAVDPRDDSIIVTRSGSRGQQLPATLFRLEKDGFLSEFRAEILNPTGIAFDKNGRLFVTARADGEVLSVGADEETSVVAAQLGVATGIAFDAENAMFVGDRNGTIYKIENFAAPEAFAILEPSVSAYHLAFGTDGRLYATAPGLASFDAIYRIDENGVEKVFYRGFGRPQGIAFDRDGNLYAAACFEGRHGIVKISPDAESVELFIAGMNLVGLCFTKEGEMIVASSDAVYSFPLGIFGNLL